MWRSPSGRRPVRVRRLAAVCAPSPILPTRIASRVRSGISRVATSAAHPMRRPRWATRRSRSAMAAFDIGCSRRLAAVVWGPWWCSRRSRPGISLPRLRTPASKWEPGIRRSPWWHGRARVQQSWRARTAARRRTLQAATAGRRSETRGSSLRLAHRSSLTWPTARRRSSTWPIGCWPSSGPMPGRPAPRNGGAGGDPEGGGRCGPTSGRGSSSRAVSIRRRGRHLCPSGRVMPSPRVYRVGRCAR